MSQSSFKSNSSSFNLHSFYEAEKTEHCQVAEASFVELFPAFSAWVEASAHALQAGKKLLFFGNGGSEQMPLPRQLNL